MGTCDNLEPGVRSLMEQGIWEFPAYITDYENYGWLCSAAAPILDGQGGLIANAYVDISMDEVAANSREFLFRLAGILAAAACVMIAAMIAAVNRTIVSPVNVLAKAAESFVSDREEHGGDTETAISRLHITTGDEIQHLAESVQKMETEINEYIRNLTAVTAEKERIGAELDVARHIQSSCPVSSRPFRTGWSSTSMLPWIPPERWAATFTISLWWISVIWQWWWRTSPERAFRRPCSWSSERP